MAEPMTEEILELIKTSATVARIADRNNPKPGIFVIMPVNSGSII